MHPARAMPYDELALALDAEVFAGNVNQCLHEELGLGLYCYTKQCVYERAWNPTTELARGLILDRNNRRIVATPFPKFFNVSEERTPIPDLPFEVFEKLDGSLIILFWHEGEWRCATKGSFFSDQAIWAKQFISRHDLTALDLNATYLCEAIYPENRIVIQYGRSELVLLAAYDGAGVEYTYEELSAVAGAVGWRAASRYPVDSISDLLARAKTLEAHWEGWVLRFANGLRLKIKGEEYLRLHRMISRLTPLSVWEAMMNGDDLISYRCELPEEFWPDFDSIFNLLFAAAQKIIHDTGEALANARNGFDLTDKDVGLMLETFPAHVRRFVFPYRKQKGDLMHGRSRETLFRAIRPTGNRLEGYVPSGSVTRVLEDAA